MRSLSVRLLIRADGRAKGGGPGGDLGLRRVDGEVLPDTEEWGRRGERGVVKEWSELETWHREP